MTGLESRTRTYRHTPRVHFGIGKLEQLLAVDIVLGEYGYRPLQARLLQEVDNRVWLPFLTKVKPGLIRNTYSDIAVVKDPVDDSLVLPVFGGETCMGALSLMAVSRK